MHQRLAVLLAAAALAVAGTARASNRLAPIPAKQAASTHGPYEMGACDTCHQRRNPRNPGPAVRVTSELCFDCHDEFRGSAVVRMDKTLHPASVAACTNCHNPHNSAKKKLQL
jgi:predicted CXXCH cytochrome family protein